MMKLQKLAIELIIYSNTTTKKDNNRLKEVFKSLIHKINIWKKAPNEANSLISNELSHAIRFTYMFIITVLMRPQ
jgi:spermidine/putrescine-binding protein